jgi:DNA invertase Pin-like site-specific DNA recombinase
VGKTAGSATCVVYCRTSTGTQRENETIGHQIQECKRLVEQHGLRVIAYGDPTARRLATNRRSAVTAPPGWLIDDGVTGRLLEGRAFAPLIDDLQHGRFHMDYLVVHNLARVARPDKKKKDPVQSQMDAARIKGVFIKAGVKVIDIDGENDPASFAFEMKMVLMAENYRLIQENTMGGKRRWLAEGYFVRGGRPAYGYAPDRDGSHYKLAAHKVHAERVQQVLDWFCEAGYVGAAEKADAKGWPTAGADIKRPKKVAKEKAGLKKKRKRKKLPIWIESVRAIVRHAEVYYTGKHVVHYDGTDYAIPCPKLIDGDTYARVLRAQKELTVAVRTELLGTGFVDCACGAHLMNNDSHGRGSFRTRCRNCGRFSVEESTFSAALWAMTKSRLFEIRTAGNGDGGSGDREAERREARAAVKHLEEESGALWDAYRAGDLPKSVWATRNAKQKEDTLHAQNELDRIEREYQAHEQKRAAEQTLGSRLEAVLDELGRKGEPSLTQKRKLLADLLNGGRAIVTPGPTKEEQWSLTLPAHKSLPAWTLRVDQIPAELFDAAVKGGQVYVMVKSNDRGVSTYSTLPLASVLAGTDKGATLGIFGAKPRPGLNTSALIESTEFPRHLVDAPAPAKRAGKGKRAR